MRTKATAREMSRSLVAEVNAVLLTRAHAIAERERVDVIQSRILSEGDYRDDDGNRITDPRKAWHITDEQFKDYVALVREADIGRRRDLPFGHCPALIAADLAMQAENNLMVGAGKWFPEFLDDGNPRVYGNDRKELIDLLIGLVVSYPGYQKPRI